MASVGDLRIDGPEPSNRVLTLPNLISALRLALVPVFALLIVGGHDLWALLVLAVSGASDWADGMLARRLGQVTRVGQMLDPAADRLFILVTLIGLTWRGVTPLWFTVVVLSRDVILACLLPLLTRHGFGPLPVSMVGKAATFSLLYAFPLLLLAEAPGVLGWLGSVAGWAFAWWGVCLYWLAGLLYTLQARRLIRDEVGGVVHGG